MPDLIIIRKEIKFMSEYKVSGSSLSLGLTQPSNLQNRLTAIITQPGIALKVTFFTVIFCALLWGPANFLGCQNSH